jgi:hypothetical protein
LTLAKASSCSGSHKNTAFFFSSGLRGSVRWARSGTNPPSCTARPRKERNPVWSVGAGKFLSAVTFSGSGLTPFGEMTWPANRTSLPICILSLDSVMPCSLQRSSTDRTRSHSSSHELAHTSMSSTIFRVFSRPSNAASDRAHHSSELAFSPMGALVYLYLPDGRRKVVSIELARSNGI